MTTTRYRINTVVSVEDDILFDHHTQHFNNRSDYNEFFIRMQQNFFNDKLAAVGFVFLNDVYYALGLPLTSGGAVIGWTRGSTVELKVVESYSRGTTHTGVLIRFNAKDKVLDYLEGR